MSFALKNFRPGGDDYSFDYFGDNGVRKETVHPSIQHLTQQAHVESLYSRNLMVRNRGQVMNSIHVAHVLVNMSVVVRVSYQMQNSIVFSFGKNF